MLVAKSPPRFEIDNIAEAASTENGLELPFSGDIQPEFIARPSAATATSGGSPATPR